MRKLIIALFVLLMISGCSNKQKSEEKDETENSKPVVETVQEISTEDFKEKENDEMFSSEENNESKPDHKVDTLKEVIDETGIDVNLNDVLLMFPMTYYVTENKAIEIIIDDADLSGSIFVSNGMPDNRGTDFSLVYIDKNDSNNEIVIQTKRENGGYSILMYEKDGVGYCYEFDRPISQMMADWLFSSARYIVGRVENENSKTVYYDNQLFGHPLENGINGSFINIDDIKCRWGDFKKDEIAVTLQENSMIFVGIPQADGLFMFGKYSCLESGYYSFYGSEVKETLPGGDGPKPPIDLSDQTILGYFSIDDASALTLYDQNMNPYLNENKDVTQFQLAE